MYKSYITLHPDIVFQITCLVNTHTLTHTHARTHTRTHTHTLTHYKQTDLTTYDAVKQRILKYTSLEDTAITHALSRCVLIQWSYRLSLWDAIITLLALPVTLA